jgi:D-alanyl-D-alanine carboxypeptidase
MMALVLAAGLAGCAAEGRTAEDDRAWRQLRAALGDLTQLTQGPPGAIVIVQDGTSRRVVRAGVSDVPRDREPRADQHMRIASAAKAYSGAVVLSLVDDGTLDLDDSLGDWLRWAPRTWDEVTVGQALHHTSGLPDFSADPAFLEHVTGNLREPLPPRELLEFVTDDPLEFEPGSRYQYSNSDNVAVALVAEAATGTRYERLLRERVYRPADLDDTSLPRGIRMPRPALRGYDYDDAGDLVDVTELVAAGYAWASGGIVSTPMDQNRFIRAYVGGKFFGEHVQRQQLDWIRRASSQPPGPGSNDAGLAIFRYRTDCGTVYGHTGNTPGYTQFMAASRDGSHSVVVSVNRQTTPDVAPRVFRQLRKVYLLAVCAADVD